MDEAEKLKSLTRKPLICCICDDYFKNPCLLSCYHSFCKPCLANRAHNGAVYCPLCGMHTESTAAELPSDVLLKKLVDLFNVDNPPCANCDKRDRTSMFFCSTCNQALCGMCRENTHRAKMFSSHEILPMSKFTQEGVKKCTIHGEPFVMYSVSQKLMLCINCFRSLPPESRQHCMDLDSAYTQAVMKLESVIGVVCETQNSVRDGIILCKTQLDELLQNTDAEKMTVHTFTKGLQEAINKTQAAILLEVQRQYEMKDRSFRNQLVSLSVVLPILQQHIVLCQTFSTTANKYQFLEVVFSMIDRLSTISSLPRFIKPIMSSQIRTNYRSEFAHCLEPWVGRLLASSVQQAQEPVYSASFPPKMSNSVPMSASIGGPPSQKQQSALKVKALEGDGPFSNHCRSFNTQVKELGSTMRNVKEKLGELRKDVTVLHRSATPPLVLRHQIIVQDCSRLNETLEQIHVELERLKSIFQSIWQEQIYRIHVEQDIFQQQMNDVINLRGEVRQLTIAAQNLEPYVTQLSSCGDSEEISKLKSLLSEISQLKDPQRIRIDKEPKNSKSLSRKSRCQSTVSLSTDAKSLGDEKRDNSMRAERAHSVSEQKSSRGVFSQLMDKVRSSKEKTECFKERSKSEDRLKECPNQGCQKVYTACSEGSVRVKPKRSTSLYQGYDLKTCGSTKELFCDERAKRELKQRKEDAERNAEFRSNYLHQDQSKDTEKYAEFRWKETTIFKGEGEKKESDYQSISEATSVFHTRNHCYSSDDDDFCTAADKRSIKSMKVAPPSPPPRATPKRRYPHSDTEDAVFYTDTSRQVGSTVTDGKAIFLVIGSRKNKNKNCIQKQRSWETFPPKKKLEDVSTFHYKKNPNNYKSQFDIMALKTETVKKADSFEGHEEAVSSLVREFQKVRMLQKQKQRPQSPNDKN